MQLVCMILRYAQYEIASVIPGKDSLAMTLRPGSFSLRVAKQSDFQYNYGIISTIKNNQQTSKM